MNSVITGQQLLAMVADLSVPDDGWSYGLRIDSAEYGDGDELPESRIWDDNEPTDELLPGTSTLDIDMIRSHGEHLSGAYPGSHVYLVTGESAGWGEDFAEHLLSDCTVVRRLA